MCCSDFGTGIANRRCLRVAIGIASTFVVAFVQGQARAYDRNRVRVTVHMCSACSFFQFRAKVQKALSNSGSSKNASDHAKRHPPQKHILKASTCKVQGNQPPRAPSEWVRTAPAPTGVGGKSTGHPRFSPYSDDTSLQCNTTQTDTQAPHNSYKAPTRSQCMQRQHPTHHGHAQYHENI